VGLRLFNVFGPRQLPNSSYSGVISIFINAMKQGQPITIYGDGEQTRDFVYVADVANALNMALLASLQPSSYAVCNIGTGQKISLIQLVELIKPYFPQWSHSLNFELARLGDIRDSQADIIQANTILEFIPKWSIESGLQQIFSSTENVLDLT
jgi:UDP-glucose 4-epimerase